MHTGHRIAALVTQRKRSWLRPCFTRRDHGEVFRVRNPRDTPQQSRPDKLLAVKPFPFVQFAAMSEHPTVSEDAKEKWPMSGSTGRLYLDGLASGRQARLQFPAHLSFSEAQRQWLRGFLCGLLDAPEGTHEAATRAPAPANATATPADPPENPLPANRTPDPLHLPQTRSTSSSAGFTPDNPGSARITSVEPVGSEPFRSWQLTFDVQGAGLTCRPGDMLGIYPSNDPDLVRRLLRLLRARGQESVTTLRGCGPAWRALLEELDIHTITPQFVHLMAQCARHADEAARLELYTRSAAPRESTVLSLLRRFPSARPQLNEFVRTLKPLAPQCFPLVHSCPEAADEFVALITEGTPEFETGWRKDLASGQLRAGDWLSIYLERKPEGYPPADPDIPVVLVAYGKGEACAHAFLEERARLRHRGRNWLFMTTAPDGTAGYYAEQFAAWQAARLITRIDVAGTGEMAHRIATQYEMLGRWLVDRSFVYVFGNESECAEVYHVLVHLLAERARCTPQEAATRLDALLTSGQLRFIAL